MGQETAQLRQREAFLRTFDETANFLHAVVFLVLIDSSENSRLYRRHRDAEARGRGVEMGGNVRELFSPEMGPRSGANRAGFLRIDSSAKILAKFPFNQVLE